MLGAIEAVKIAEEAPSESYSEYKELPPKTVRLNIWSGVEYLNKVKVETDEEIFIQKERDIDYSLL